VAEVNNLDLQATVAARHQQESAVQEGGSPTEQVRAASPDSLVATSGSNLTKHHPFQQHHHLSVRSKMLDFSFLYC
jgi:hypothetical protein